MLKSIVSIDLETTGLNPETCQILELGAAVDNGAGACDWPTFHCYVEHRVIRGEPYALQMNQKILLALAEKDPKANYFPADRVGHAFGLWLETVGVDPMKVVAAGKNFASFDLQFLLRLPDFSDYVRFHHRSYDPAMLYMDWEKDELPPAMSTCMKRAGLQDEVSHRAVDDAIVVLKLLRHARFEGR